MELYISLSGILTALIYVLIGLLVFAAAFQIAAKSILPRFRELIVEQGNTAAALLIGLLAIAIAIIVAAAVH